MRIAIDVDGVLIDMGNYLLEYGSKYFLDKYNIPIKFPNGYEISEMFLVSPEKDHEFWLAHIYHYGVTYEARYGAAEIIKKLKEEGNEIIIMTARGGTEENTLPKEEMQELVKSWLKRNDIVYDELVFSEEDKLSYCQDMNIDIMVEDKPRNVTMISSHIPTICYNALYNQFIEGQNIHRVYSWAHIYQKIKEIQNDNWM